MTKTVDSREIALDVLIEILEKGTFSHVILRQALEKYQYLEKQERALITRIVEGTIEYKLTIDAILNQASKTPVKKMKPLIRTLLRMSVYQIMYLDRIPDHAICNEAVKLAGKRKFQGLKGFVNGVLRGISRNKESFTFDSLSEQYSMPEWLIQHWEKSYSKEQITTMLQAFLTDTPTCVRCNLSRASKDEIIRSLEAQQVTVSQSPYLDSMLLLSQYDYLEGLDAFANGWIQVQDLSSGFVGKVANPQEGNIVLDVCGAPGGKSLHIADLLHGTGQVVVRDLTPEKVYLIEGNIERSSYDNIEAQVWDALVLDEFWREKADIVIADLPCSGLGVIGKKPDIKYQVSKESMDSLAQLQRDILSVVINYVKPGGTLLYSTCTINKQENEEQVAWILENFPVKSKDLTGVLGSKISEETMQNGYLQLLPGIYPCDGFFISAFQKQIK